MVPASSTAAPAPASWSRPRGCLYALVLGDVAGDDGPSYPSVHRRGYPPRRAARRLRPGPAAHVAQVAQEHVGDHPAGREHPSWQAGNRRGPGETAELKRVRTGLGA
jgi:hypothetical protein